MTYLIGGFIFGWARPVPYNPYNLRNQRWGPAVVGAAGPLANILIALVFAASLRFLSGFATPAWIEISSAIIFINILLAIFNLLPIPPLDGSKVLFAILPQNLYQIQLALEQYGFIILILFIFVLWRYLLPIIFFIFRLLVGP
jgi:Zn-dependent protease